MFPLFFLLCYSRVKKKKSTSLISVCQPTLADVRDFAETYMCRDFWAFAASSLELQRTTAFPWVRLRWNVIRGPCCMHRVRRVEPSIWSTTKNRKVQKLQLQLISKLNSSITLLFKSLFMFLTQSPSLWWRQRACVSQLVSQFRIGPDWCFLIAS